MCLLSWDPHEPISELFELSFLAISPSMHPSPQIIQVSRPLAPRCVSLCTFHVLNKSLKRLCLQDFQLFQPLSVSSRCSKNWNFNFYTPIPQFPSQVYFITSLKWLMFWHNSLRPGSINLCMPFMLWESAYQVLLQYTRFRHGIFFNSIRGPINNYQRQTEILFPNPGVPSIQTIFANPYLWIVH